MYFYFTCILHIYLYFTHISIYVKYISTYVSISYFTYVIYREKDPAIALLPKWPHDLF